MYLDSRYMDYKIIRETVNIMIVPSISVFHIFNDFAFGQTGSGKYAQAIISDKIVIENILNGAIETIY